MTDGPALYVLPLIGTPGRQDLGDAVWGRNKRFVGWFGHDKMCHRTENATKAECSPFRHKTPKGARESFVDEAVTNGFWLDDWHACMRSRPRVCPELVARDVALSGEGAVLTTMHKFLYPPERSRKSLESYAGRIAKGRQVIIDEVHRWDTWHQFQGHGLPMLKEPPGRGKPAWTLKETTQRPADYVATLEAWLAAHAKTASRLYFSKGKQLPDVQAKRQQLLAETTHRVPLFPDRMTLRDLDTELVRLAAKQKEWDEDVEAAASYGVNLPAIEGLLAATAMGELVVSCSPRYDSHLDATIGWDYNLAAADIVSESRNGRLLRTPRFTILRSIVQAADTTLLLSATPPAEKEIRYAVGQRVQKLERLKGPGLDVLLEQSSRSQLHLTFKESKRERQAAENLVMPVIRDGNGMLFLRSKREYDHERWRKLPEAQVSYCRGPESVGKQSKRAFVALAGPPHLPAGLEPFCFTDPVDQGNPETDTRKASEAGSRARTWLMLQELYQATSRTGSVNDKQRAKAIVFGCPTRIIPDLLDEKNQPHWARTEAKYSLLRGQGSTGYDARCLAIRSWLAGVNLAYAKAPATDRFGRDRQFVRPALVEAWYRIMMAIEAGKLPNPFKAKQYQNFRFQQGQRRGNYLHEIVERWVPRNKEGKLLAVELDGYPAKFEFSTEPLRGDWKLDATVGRDPRIRRLKGQPRKPLPSAQAKDARR